MPQIRRLLMFPIIAHRSKHCWTCFDGGCGRKTSAEGLGRADAPHSSALGLVCRPSYSTGSGSRCSDLLGRLCMRCFAPNTFPVGVAFGLVAGLLEEIGRMRYAFPKMRHTRSALSAALILGLLWSAWHLPVIGNLGTATPHGPYWLRYLLAFNAIPRSFWGRLDSLLISVFLIGLVSIMPLESGVELVLIDL